MLHNKNDSSSNNNIHNDLNNDITINNEYIDMYLWKSKDIYGLRFSESHLNT